MKRYEDPKWVQTMGIGLNYSYAMAEFAGAGGLSQAELQALAPRIVSLQQEMAEKRQAGRLAFMELPYQDQLLQEIRKSIKPLLEWCWDVVVLGIGGSALGARALHQSLCHPQYNKFPMARRHHRPGLWVADNIDPDSFYGLLDGLDLRRTGFLIISKSGATTEILAQFLWVYHLLKGRMGEAKARERLIIVTDPEKGPLRRLAVQEGLFSVNTSPQVSGRFSLLSAVGLLPAALVGIDLEELLAGARFMDQRLKGSGPGDNLAYRLAALFYLFAAQKQRSILVFMPYAGSLAGIAQWFRYLWAESVGKKQEHASNHPATGSTPVAALGVTDQHSQLQLYMEGRPDKLITFLEVEKFQHRLEIPNLYPGIEGVDYLGGHSLNELLQAESQATAFNLMKGGRPSLTLRLPEINPFTIGQLVYLLEVATVAAASLFGVNPFDQPGVEGVKQTTAALMGQPGFESYYKEFNEAGPRLKKYRL